MEEPKTYFHHIITIIIFKFKIVNNSDTSQPFFDLYIFYKKKEKEKK